MTRRVYSVSVQLQFEMPVVAADPDEAERVAESNWEEELAMSVERPLFHAVAITKPGEFEGCIPWGPADDDPGRDWTIEQWLAKGQS